MGGPSEKRSTTRQYLFIYSASKKPSRCYAKRCPWRGAFLGESNGLTLSMKQMYAMALYGDTGATLDDLREAVTMLEDTERTARRVLGAAHPTTAEMETALLQAQAALRARETPSGPGA